MIHRIFQTLIGNWSGTRNPVSSAHWR